MDWQSLFTPSQPVFETVVRGTVMYLMLFALMRLMPRRQIGTLGVSDLLVVVLIADAAQNGMAGEYHSITEGILLVVTILAWDYVIDWMDYRFPQLGLNSPPPVVLVSNGKLRRRVLHREKVTHEELMSQLRAHGVSDVAQVRRATLEGDGRITVIRQNGDDTSAEDRPRN